jgi:ABC-type sulfate transport system permease subunit
MDLPTRQAGGGVGVSEEVCSGLFGCRFGCRAPGRQIIINLLNLSCCVPYVLACVVFVFCFVARSLFLAFALFSTSAYQG